MSLIKGKRQANIILDFSEFNLSKNKIKEALRCMKITNFNYRGKNLIIFDNFIKVGAYSIKLVLQENYDNKFKTLNEYGRFQVRLFETDKEIKIKTDYRFKKQNWVAANLDYNFRVKDLVSAILYCKKLENLKLFL